MRLPWPPETEEGRVVESGVPITKLPEGMVTQFADAWQGATKQAKRDIAAGKKHHPSGLMLYII